MQVTVIYVKWHIITSGGRGPGHSKTRQTTVGDKTNIKYNLNANQVNRDGYSGTRTKCNEALGFKTKSNK